LTNTQLESAKSSEKYRICTRCIMDTSAAGISFDPTGECQFCKIYAHRNATERFPGRVGAGLLKTYVEKIKARGKGKEYDCIVGVSGGVDSTTVLYTVKELGLRPLAVHLDNGWDSELAVDNIKRVLGHLEVDLFTHVIDWDEFRDLQLSFLKASVPNAEIPTDHAINAFLYNTAMSHNIRYIFGGGNIQTEAFMPRDLKHIKAIHELFGSYPLKSFPQISLPGCVYAVIVKRIRIVAVLNYIDYHKAEAKERITKEFGWRDYGGKHYESIYTRFFQGYILPVKFGYDKRRVHLSNLICSGELTREEALEEMEREAYAPDRLAEDRTFVIKKLGLTEPEFEAIMGASPKMHIDYPCHYQIFEGMQQHRARFKKLAMRV
jgi:N-acetyl sugar amidotransferase